MIRIDLSSKLIHLTRTVDGMSAEERFQQILAEGALRGSSKDVRGGFKVIAFTEAPITMLANVLANASALKMRYAPLGVMIDKVWLYKRDRRPVIYQSNAEFDVLPESKQHLHVRYEPDKDQDYSWEREWRIKTDYLKLDPQSTTVIVPSRSWERKYHAVYAGSRNRAALVTHGFALDGGPTWHFIALEDLGIEPVSFHDIE